jgi:hypothetical protein
MTGTGQAACGSRLAVDGSQAAWVTKHLPNLVSSQRPIADQSHYLCGAGRVKTIVVPRPSVLSAHILPPCASMRVREM